MLFDIVGCTAADCGAAAQPDVCAGGNGEFAATVPRRVQPRRGLQEPGKGPRGALDASPAGNSPH